MVTVTEVTVTEVTVTMVTVTMVTVMELTETELTTYLRVSLEVSLEKRLLEPRLRVWVRRAASSDSVGEAGGPL